MIGVYGVTAFTVGARTREIGIRMALGASDQRVRTQVFRQSMGQVGLGIALGLGGALGLTRFLTGFVYGVSPADGATYAAVALFILLAAATAVALPARRATRVDPVATLREA